MSHFIELKGTSGLFSCTLDKIYRLEGEWEVALLQIEIAKKWEIDIEHRPKIQHNPEYVQDDDFKKYKEIVQKIISEPTGRNLEENKSKLAKFLVNMVQVDLLKYKYNSAMEFLLTYIEADLTKVIANLTTNRDNNNATFNPIIQQIQKVKILYESKYKTTQDGTSQKALEGCDMYYNNNKIDENTKRFLANPLLVNIDIINPDTCLRSITSTKHDYNNLQFHKVTKNFFDSIRVEIQEPIKRTLQTENNPQFIYEFN
jgi:hypothetical protein